MSLKSLFSSLPVVGFLVAAAGCDASEPLRASDLAQEPAARLAQSLISDTSTRFASAVLSGADKDSTGEDSTVQQAKTPVAFKVSVADTRRLDLDATLGAAAARNGIDGIRYRDRVYLGVRSVLEGQRASVRVDVVSSANQQDWRSETSFVASSDIHAPRFLVLGDKLMVYVSELEAGVRQLRPNRVLQSELVADTGLWREFQRLPLDGQVVWRTKVEGGVPLMTTYSLGEKTYEFDDEVLEVNLLTTKDGYDWRPLSSGRRAVYRGGGSEAAISSDDDGRLYSVVRNTAGDESGFGSSLCAAKASDWAQWECVHDPNKYDSPTLFNHGGELFLVARRHLADSDQGPPDEGFSLLRRAENEARELASPTRCSLWHFDRRHQRVDFVLDLPSRGNTCSPTVIPGQSPDEFVIYDHSSDLRGPDLALREGLASPTFIYRHVLRFQ